MAMKVCSNILVVILLLGFKSVCMLLASSPHQGSECTLLETSPAGAADHVKDVSISWNFWIFPDHNSFLSISLNFQFLVPQLLQTGCVKLIQASLVMLQVTV